MRNKVCDSVYNSTLFIRDYAIQLSVDLNIEIQLDHFGYRISLSTEGWKVQLVDVNHNSESELHAHLSNDS